MLRGVGERLRRDEVGSDLDRSGRPQPPLPTTRQTTKEAPLATGPCLTSRHNAVSHLTPERTDGKCLFMMVSTRPPTRRVGVHHPAQPPRRRHRDGAWSRAIPSVTGPRACARVRARESRGRSRPRSRHRAPNHENAGRGGDGCADSAEHPSRRSRRVGHMRLPGSLRVLWDCFSPGRKNGPASG